eukprot:1099861-Amorphochlora_amoeboformis.AAC.3
MTSARIFGSSSTAVSASFKALVKSGSNKFPPLGPIDILRIAKPSSRTLRSIPGGKGAPWELDIWTMCDPA